MVKSAYKNSTLTYGLIIPRSSLVAVADEWKMPFGTDSFQYSIRYANLNIYKEEEETSLLLSIILPPDRKAPGYDEYEKKTTTYKKMITTTIQYPLIKDEVRVHFGHLKPDKYFDSSHMNGYIKAGNDFFFSKPLFKVIPLHGKNVKSLQVLQGYV
ncbi:MAG: hypothetical protein Q8941_08550 [Bacteroidota bacterium]|nr:hypothetical protein [Bacteroidota bacterium]